MMEFPFDFVIVGGAEQELCSRTDWLNRHRRVSHCLRQGRATAGFQQSMILVVLRTG